MLVLVADPWLRIQVVLVAESWLPMLVSVPWFLILWSVVADPWFGILGFLVADPVLVSDPFFSPLPPLPHFSRPLAGFRASRF